MNVAQAEVLNLESGAKQVLQETFGYQQFRPGQEEIIDTVPVSYTHLTLPTKA